MKKQTSFVISLIVVILLCTTSVLSIFVWENDVSEKVLIIHDGDLSSFEGDVIDVYGRYAFVEVEQKHGLELFKSPVSDVISVRGQELDTSCLAPSTHEDIQGSHGLYLIKLMGPVNPTWREHMEGMGVEIISYTPYYSYTAWMEHDIYREVLDLYFVDWVGPYIDEYKTVQELGDKVLIDVVPSALTDTADSLQEIDDVVAVEVLKNTNRLMVELNQTVSLDTITSIREVIFISPLKERQLNSELESQIIGGHWDEGSPSSPYRGHGDHGAYVNQIGYTGKDVVIGVADTGLGDGTVGDAGHPDFTGRVIGGNSFAGEDWSDGHGHGTHCTGSAAGDTYSGTGVIYGGHGPYFISQGLAYDSYLYGQKVFTDGGSWIGPAEDYEILREAKANGGVYVHSNSWGYGYSGVYFTSDSDYDRAVRDSDPGSWGNDPLIPVVAAGNAGEDAMGNRDEQSIGSPGNSKNVITVGAAGTYMPDADQYGGSATTDEVYNVTTWSSKGWTADNRVKPDVVAPGRAVLSTSSPLTTSGNIYTEDDRYEWMSGTSMATPAVSGAVGVVIEWYEDVYGERPSPAMLKALLINSARPLLNDLNSDDEIDHIPNRDEGWGMVDIASLLSREESSFFVDQSVHLTTGEVKEYEVRYDEPDQPLKFTLVWTDKYAEAYDNPSLKNDLDIEVVSPSGQVYRGNAFQNGWTPSNTNALSDFDHNGDGTDDANTVENIFIHQDYLEEGTYTVRIIGSNVPEDALNSGSPQQDYALVAYNTVYGSEGSVYLGREEYTTDDIVDVTVYDGDLIGQSEFDVLLTSDTEPDGMTLTLTPGVQEWRFTGSAYISSTDSHNSLKVSHGDTLTVSYDDAGTIREDHAIIDGSPPEITEIEVDSKFAVRISWTTDEPSWGKVGYGSSEVMMSPDFNTEHEVILDGLIPGMDYDFIIICQDSAGNKIESSPHTFTVGEVDDVEDGNIAWIADTNWNIAEGDAYSGDHYWDCGDGNYGTYWDEKLVSPRIDTTLWSEAEFTWWHRYNFNEGDDGGVVEVFDGSEWVPVTPLGGYDGVLSDWGENVLGGRDAFTGVQDEWAMETVDLTPFVGTQDLRVRFWVGTDGYSNWPDPREGWLVDDIGLTGQIETDTLEISLSSEGWNFVSTNIVPEDTSIGSILENPEDGISGSYDRVMYYDAKQGEWLSYVPGRAGRFNNLDDWDHTMGLWIHMVSEDTLTIHGFVPTNTEIYLHPGWNMVGMPSETSGNHGIPDQVTRVGYFDSTSEYNLNYDHEPEDFIFQPAKGYWIYNGASYSVIWSLEY